MRSQSRIVLARIMVKLKIQTALRILDLLVIPVENPMPESILLNVTKKFIRGLRESVPHVENPLLIQSV